MKNSILLIALGSLILTSCSKDESFEQTEEQTLDSIYISKQNNGSTNWERTPMNALHTGTDFTYTAYDNNEIGETNGVFVSTSRDANTITWTGFQDETGAYGNAEVLISSPSYTLRLQMITECVTVKGKEAVYGGIITQVTESSGNPPPFNVNWRFYFNVVDSGQNRGVSYDQISHTRIFASPRSQSLCNVYLPGDRIWSSQGYENVHQPGFVEVTNRP